MSNQDALIQSYVWHGEDCYSVSTINRASSAALAYGLRYAETLVWRVDPTTKERGHLVHQGEGPENGIRTHLNFCETLHRGGADAFVEVEA